MTTYHQRRNCLQVNPRTLAKCDAPIDHEGAHSNTAKGIAWTTNPYTETTTNDLRTLAQVAADNDSAMLAQRAALTTACRPGSHFPDCSCPDDDDTFPDSTFPDDAEAEAIWGSTRWTSKD